MRTYSELNSYLNDDIFFDDEDIFKYSLKMWKNIEYRYSIIALMTKNILSISTFDVNVEWIFNTAYDICHYCWNCLNSDTIEMIMLMKWYEKFKLWKFEKNFDLFNEKKNESWNKWNMNWWIIWYNDTRDDWMRDWKQWWKYAWYWQWVAWCNILNDCYFSFFCDKFMW